MKRLAALILLMASSLRGDAEVLGNPDLPLLGGRLAGPMLRATDGRVILGGEFSRVGEVERPHLVRFNLDGSVDAGWQPEFDANISDLGLDALGRLYTSSRWGVRASTAGPFQQIRRFSLQANGVSDPGFLPAPPAGASDDGFALLVDSVGGALYGSYFVPGTGYRIVKYALDDGATDPAFSVMLNSLLFRMLRIGDDLILAGSFATVNGVARRGLAKVDRLTGEVDLAWDPGALIPPNQFGAQVRAVLFDGDHVFVGGSFQGIGGATRGLARLSLATGAADPAWLTAVSSLVTALARDSQQRLLIQGSLETIGGAPWNWPLARFQADGSHDVAWADTSTPAGTRSRDLLIEPDDGVLALHFGFGDVPTQLARHDAAEGQRSRYAEGDLLGAGVVRRLLPVDDGRFVLAGNDLRLGSTVSLGALRLEPDLDASADWRSGLGDSLSFLSLQDAAVDGSHVYLAGFLSQQTATTLPLRRLALGDGRLDPGFALQGIGNNVSSRLVAVDANDGFVYLAGSLGSAQLARFAKSDGQRDTTWAPGAIQSFQLAQLRLHGGDLYLGGAFTQVGGQDLPGLARISRSGNGQPDPGWRPAPGFPVSSFVIDSDLGHVYAAGSLSVDGEASRVRVTRHRLSDGSLDSQWSSALDVPGSVSRLALDAEGGSLLLLGKIEAGCQGELLSAISAADGAVDPHLALPTEPPGAINDAAPLGGNRWLLAGQFSRIAGQSRSSVAAIRPGAILVNGFETTPRGCVNLR
jgi:hypothetical protein